MCSEVRIFGTLEVCTVDCYQVASTLLVNISVLRIRDVYPLSRIRVFSIPDPGPEFFHPASGIRIKRFKYLNPKKWFISSRTYDPGCSSRIPDPYFLPILDPGVKKAPDPGSGSATLEYLKELSLVRFTRMYTCTVNTVNSQFMYN